MKKIAIIFFVGGILIASVAKAQTVQDGISDYYAERYKGAKAAFEKLIATNPNNIDATYWLGQTLIASGDVPAAREVYSKALLASANAPLLIVGMGQVELNENKFSEATQRFETAITMTRGKKGDDPVILTAVGRAITNTYKDKDKKGDINYAVEKLEAATQRDPNYAEAFLNLGTAYLKAKPGEGGGKAFENFTKAATAAPTFPVPCFRLAKLFGSQKNWELYEKYLGDAITRDPRFAPAYYELYYYKLGKQDFTSAKDMAAKYIASSDPDPQADHFLAQTIWAEKNYDEAIRISKEIIAKAGNDTKPRTYILLADAYLSKKDTASAKQYIDLYFAKAKPDDISPIHYKIKGDIYLCTCIPGGEEIAIVAYTEAINADSVLQNKLDLIKPIAATLKGRKLYDKQAVMEQMVLDLKPNPSLTDNFNAGLAYYFAGKYDVSRNIWLKVQEKFPAEYYGYEWAFRVSLAVDTVKKDSIAVPDALKLIDFAQKDTAKFKKQFMLAAGFLVGYYNNDAKDPVTALDYVRKIRLLDPVSETWKGIEDQLLKATKQSSPKSSNDSKSGTSSQAAGMKEPKTGNN